MENRSIFIIGSKPAAFASRVFGNPGNFGPSVSGSSNGKNDKTDEPPLSIVDLTTVVFSGQHAN